MKLTCLTEVEFYAPCAWKKGKKNTENGWQQNAAFCPLHTSDKLKTRCDSYFILFYWYTFDACWLVERLLVASAGNVGSLDTSATTLRTVAWYQQHTLSAASFCAAAAPRRRCWSCATVLVCWVTFQKQWKSPLPFDSVIHNCLYTSLYFCVLFHLGVRLMWSVVCLWRCCAVPTALNFTAMFLHQLLD